MLTKFFDPKNDFAFRKLFGRVEHKNILIQFLNDVLDPAKYPRITDVRNLETIQDPLHPNQKTGIVDVLATDQNGAKHIIEMQVAKADGFKQRLHFYASRAYQSQLGKGEEYTLLRPVYLIAILDFVEISRHNRVKSHHWITDDVDHKSDFEQTRYTVIELPKFTKTADELETMLDKWCYFFKHATETNAEDLKKVVADTPAVYESYEVMNQLSWSDEEVKQYDQSQKNRRDYLSTLSYARKEGLAEGLEKGREEGLEKGREEGLAAARLKMKAAGFSDEDVKKILSISVGC